MPFTPTTMEKIANNTLTIVVARFAIILMPPLFGFVMLVAQKNWNDLLERQAAIETALAKQAITVQDHEYRLNTGKAAREEFQRGANIQFIQLDTALRDLAIQMAKVQTTLENRLPRTQ